MSAQEPSRNDRIREIVSEWAEVIWARHAMGQVAELGSTVMVVAFPDSKPGARMIAGLIRPGAQYMVTGPCIFPLQTDKVAAWIGGAMDLSEREAALRWSQQRPLKQDAVRVVVCYLDDITVAVIQRQKDNVIRIH